MSKNIKILNAAEHIRFRPKMSENDESYNTLVTLMEENPMLFYDTSELVDLDGHEYYGVTQKTIQEWEEWIEEQMKENKE